GGPALSHQILQCPMLDDRMTTHSSQMLNGEGVWDRTSNRTGWTALLGESVGGPDVSPYAAPARAQALSGLPATYLEVGGVEVFRDEVIQYGTRLAQSGVPVEMHIWPGGCHGFDGLVPQAALSRSANQTRESYLHRILD
ncbi:alpha/beta hydrolase fold domain-containing protein, partial [Rhodococcus sp. CX]|uniref:alpha/beta hydrolase fold domain-containing protein n=1 Tax=Rhodococcus sp. CX TaxID=2789880 RepID=UPI0018CDCDB5